MLPWFVRRWLGLVRGGVERTPVAPGRIIHPPNTAFDQAYTEAIRAAPDDPEPYRAYARWLCEQNDPRGALIARMLDGDASPPVEPHLWGPLWEQPGVELTWRWGFWDALCIRDPWGERAASLLERALDDPGALVLRRLEVHSGRMERVADVLADAPSMLLHALLVDAEGGLLGTWAAVWPRLPRLEELSMHGAMPQLGSMALPELRTLEIVGPLDVQAVADLQRAALPRLERLVVSDPEPLRAVWGDRVQLP